MIKSELIQKIAAANQHLYHRDIERIVARHGGRVWARNRSGGGAEVGFSLAAGGPTSA